MRGKHGARAAARRTQQEYETEIAALQHRAAKAEGALADCRTWIEGEQRSHAAEVRELRDRLREQRPPALLDAEREAEGLRRQLEEAIADRDKLHAVQAKVITGAVRYVAKQEKMPRALAFEVVLFWATGQRITVGDWAVRNPEAARRLNAAAYGGMAKMDAAIQRSAEDDGWLADASFPTGYGGRYRELIEADTEA